MTFGFLGPSYLLVCRHCIAERVPATVFHFSNVNCINNSFDLEWTVTRFRLYFTDLPPTVTPLCLRAYYYVSPFSPSFDTSTPCSART